MMNFRFPQFSQIPIETVVPNLSKDALLLLKEMLQWNPAKRPTAAQCMKFAYFQNVDISSQITEKLVTNVKTAPNMSEFKKSSSVYHSNSKTVPSYVGSPNVDNHSIQQLQLQIGSQVMANGTNKASNKTALSIKDQYLSRSRYVAGQNTKSSMYKSSGWSAGRLAKV